MGMSVFPSDVPAPGAKAPMKLFTGSCIPVVRNSTKSLTPLPSNARYKPEVSIAVFPASSCVFILAIIFGSDFADSLRSMTGASVGNEG